jgi:hypothetical protein
MPFTDEERRLWHEQRRRQRGTVEVEYGLQHTATCLHCGNPFPFDEGSITDDAALCDICLGD